MAKQTKQKEKDLKKEGTRKEIENYIFSLQPKEEWKESKKRDYNTAKQRALNTKNKQLALEIIGYEKGKQPKINNI